MSGYNLMWLKGNAGLDAIIVEIWFNLTFYNFTTTHLVL